MSEETFANKYRPKKLEEVIGQDVVVQSISNALQGKSLHHAYIFAGKFGCGKTSMARLLAAIENCTDLNGQDPCGKCNNCKAIFSGKSLDVKELDAASNRSIDDIRALKDDIRHNPIDCRMKYVIIDEAHSLTGQAAEAALKMIEEPPKHVRFILATTDPHKLKETIHSRCITFKFFSVPWSVLAKHLTTIADKEGLKYEPDALKLAARAASGSVRNALQNLQTLLNYVGEGEITVDAAKAMLGAVDEVLYFNFMKSIMETQATTGIQIVENLLKDGRNADDVVNGLYAHLRNLMVAKTCREQMSDFGFTEDEVKRFQHQANAMGLALILELMGMLADVSRGLIFNLDPQTLLDKYVIDAIVAYRMKMQREQQ